MRHTVKGGAGFWTWRLYPVPGSTLFVRVFVFDRRKDMREFFRMLSPGVSQRSANRTNAVCCEMEVRTGAGRLKPVVAAVLFDKSRIGAGLVSHEMTHALAAWARRTGLDLTDMLRESVGVIPFDAPEEQAARILGELVRQFYVRAERVGLS